MSYVLLEGIDVERNGPQQDICIERKGRVLAIIKSQAVEEFSDIVRCSLSSSFFATAPLIFRIGNEVFVCQLSQLDCTKAGAPRKCSASLQKAVQGGSPNSPRSKLSCTCTVLTDANAIGFQAQQFRAELERNDMFKAQRDALAYALAAVVHFSSIAPDQNDVHCEAVMSCIGPQEMLAEVLDSFSSFTAITDKAKCDEIQRKWYTVSAELIKIASRIKQKCSTGKSTVTNTLLLNFASNSDLLIEIQSLVDKCNALGSVHTQAKELIRNLFGGGANVEVTATQATTFCAAISSRFSSLMAQPHKVAVSHVGALGQKLCAAGDFLGPIVEALPFGKLIATAISTLASHVLAMQAMSELAELVSSRVVLLLLLFGEKGVSEHIKSNNAACLVLVDIYFSMMACSSSIEAYNTRSNTGRLWKAKSAKEDIAGTYATLCEQFQTLANCMSLSSLAVSADRTKTMLAFATEAKLVLEAVKGKMNESEELAEREAERLEQQLSTIEHHTAKLVAGQCVIAGQVSELTKVLTAHFSKPPVERWAVSRLTGTELRNLSAFNDDSTIGTGASCTVYEGCYKNVPVAIKKFLKGPTEKSIVNRELKQMSKVKHRNIIAPLAWCDDEKNCAIVFPLLSALDDAMVTTLSDPDILVILYDVAKALWYMHEERRVHRDVKPGNILVAVAQGAIDRAVLCDLGLAAGLSSMSITGPAGTSFFMDKEASELDATPNQLHDVYALGITIAVLWLRRDPTAQDSVPDMVRQAEEGANPFPLVPLLSRMVGAREKRPQMDEVFSTVSLIGRTSVPANPGNVKQQKSAEQSAVHADPHVGDSTPPQPAPLLQQPFTVAPPPSTFSLTDVLNLDIAGLVAFLSQSQVAPKVVQIISDSHCDGRAFSEPDFVRVVFTEERMTKHGILEVVLGRLKDLHTSFLKKLSDEQAIADNAIDVDISWSSQELRDKAQPKQKRTIRLVNFSGLSGISIGSAVLGTIFRKSALSELEPIKIFMDPSMRGITCVGDYLFDGCKFMRAVDLTHLLNVTTIGAHAFEKCSALTTIDLTPFSKVLNLGSPLFYDCGSLQKIVAPRNLCVLEQCLRGGLSSVLVVDEEGNNLNESKSCAVM